MVHALVQLSNAGRHSEVKQASCIAGIFVPEHQRIALLGGIHVVLPDSSASVASPEAAVRTTRFHSHSHSHSHSLPVELLWACPPSAGDEFCWAMSDPPSFLAEYNATCTRLEAITSRLEAMAVRRISDLALWQFGVTREFRLCIITILLHICVHHPLFRYDCSPSTILLHFATKTQT